MLLTRHEMVTCVSNKGLFKFIFFYFSYFLFPPFTCLNLNSWISNANYWSRLIVKEAQGSLVWIPDQADLTEVPSGKAPNPEIACLSCAAHCSCTPCSHAGSWWWLNSGDKFHCSLYSSYKINSYSFDLGDTLKAEIWAITIYHIAG